MGCGVACVASVLGTNYERASRLFANLHGDDHTRGYSRRALIAALERRRRFYTFHTLGDLDLRTLPLDSIVFIRDEQHPPGHYLVKRSDGWMDPLSPRPRKRLTSRPLSYIRPSEEDLGGR
jgi:hypothetical protein